MFQKIFLSFNFYLLFTAHIVIFFNSFIYISLSFLQASFFDVMAAIGKLGNRVNPLSLFARKDEVSKIKENNTVLTIT